MLLQFGDVRIMSRLCFHSLVVPVKRLKFVNIVIPEKSSNLGYTILPMCLYGIALHHPYSPE